MLLITSSKWYDLAKWSAAVFIPALQVLWLALSTVWGWPFQEEVSITIAAVNAFLGAIVGISNNQYLKENK